MRVLSVLVCVLAGAVASRDLSAIRPTLKHARVGPPRRLPLGVGRILDNNVARPCQLPYQALVRSANRYIHTGSLITATTVLTSATAVHGYETWSILLGTTSLEKPLEGETPWGIKSTWAIAHPGYNTTYFYNNVAIVILPKKAPLGKCIATVALPSPKEAHLTFSGRTAVVSGWGFPLNSSMVSNQLLFTEVVIIPNDLCKKYYHHDYVREGTLCAANENRGIDNGDSGAPLVIHMDKGRKQVGVASFWMDGASGRTMPAAYARITSVLDWIREVASSAAQ